MMPMHLAHEPHLGRSFRIGPLLSAFAVKRFLLLCWPGGLAPLSFSISSSRATQDSQVFPLLCSLKQALKSPQVSSPQHQARIQKGLLVTSYFIPQSDSLLSIEGGGSYFRSTICLSALPWPQTCAPPPLLLPLRAP